MMLVLSIIITVICVLIVAYFKYSFQYWRKLNVPYVEPSIPWGNYPNRLLYKKSWGEVITQMYNSMKEKGHKYFGIYLINQPCLVLADPKYVRLFLSHNSENFNARNFYYNEKDDPISAHLVSLNGTKWKDLRQKMTPIFTSGKIKTFFHIFLKCAKDVEKILQHSLETKTSFNAKDTFSSFTADVIINSAFGLEVDKFRKNEFTKHTKAAINFNMTKWMVTFLGSAFPETCRKLGFRQIPKTSADFFIEVISSTVAYRERNKLTRKDFLQLLINLQNERRSMGEDFTIEEITAQSFIFFLAGYESSAITLAFCLYEMASRPEIDQNLYKEITNVLAKSAGEITYEAVQEMTYMESFICEILRLYSPITFATRICSKDFYFKDADITLKKGSTILIPIRSLHLDPELFPEPLECKPERFFPENRDSIDQHSYLPFGRGPRVCIGQRFALIELKTMLALIIQKYKFRVNSKTLEPFQQSPSSFLYDVVGGIRIDCERRGP